MIGVMLALAILILQLHYGVIQHGTFWFQVYSVGWPYFGVMVALSLWCLLKAPIALDNERVNALNERQTVIDVLRIESAHLKKELAKPIRTPAENHYYEKAKAALSKLPPEAVAALQHLHQHGKMKFGTFYPVLPSGMSGQKAHELYEQCTRDGLLSKDMVQGLGEVTYTIAPGMKPALEDILFGETHC